MIQYLYSYQYPKDIIPTIDFKKDNDDKKWKNEYFDVSYQYNKEIEKGKKIKKNIKEEDIVRIVKTARDNKIGPMTQNIISNIEPENIPSIIILTENLEHSFEISKDDVSISLKQERIELKDNQKLSHLKFMMWGEQIYKLVKKYKFCKKEEMVFQYKMMIISQLYNYLEIGGNFMTSFTNICRIEDINYIYLLSLLFERIIMINGTVIYCYGYLGDKGILREKFMTLSNRKFYIHPKPEIEKMIHYIQNNLKKRMKMNILVQKHKYQKYIEESFYETLNGYMETSLDSKKIKIIFENFLLYFKIQKTPEWIVQFMRETRQKEIKSLLSILNDDKIRLLKRVLKIGMSYGMYEEVFLESKPYLHMKVISKNENNYWEKVGIEYLEKKGYKENIELFSEDIFYALPKILQNYGESSFDIIFIEDVLSMDKMIYLWMHFGLLIRMFGHIIFDKMVNVVLYNFLNFVEKNYEGFQKIETSSGLVIFKKINRYVLDNMITSI